MFKKILTVCILTSGTYANLVQILHARFAKLLFSGGIERMGLGITDFFCSYSPTSNGGIYHPSVVL